MNGIRYLLDTNAVIAIVNGNRELISRLNTADLVAFSIISVVEFLSFSNLSTTDKLVFDEIVSEGSVINLSYDDRSLVDSIAKVRASYRLKMPDAILAATALTNDCTLITNDREFRKVPELSILNFNLQI